MKIILPVLIVLTVAGCANAATEPKSQLSAREQKALDRAIAGKVPGRPEICVSALRGQNLHAIGDHTLIYRINKNLIYRNDLQGACHGLDFGDTLVMRVYGSQYCRGDIAHVMDLPSGMRTGSCTLGDFVPYRTPGTGN